MIYPREADTCRYCPKPMSRRTNGQKRICTECNRKRKFWYQYGITVEQYQQIFEEQGGKCAICKEPESALRKDGSIRYLCVDHEHETGAIRGLLCYHCNQGLGQFRDNPDYLITAAAYVGLPPTPLTVKPSLGTPWATTIEGV